MGLIFFSLSDYAIWVYIWRDIQTRNIRVWHLQNLVYTTKTVIIHTLYITDYEFLTFDNIDNKLTTTSARLETICSVLRDPLRPCQHSSYSTLLRLLSSVVLKQSWVTIRLLQSFRLDKIKRKLNIILALIWRFKFFITKLISLVVNLFNRQIKASIFRKHT